MTIASKKTEKGGKGLKKDKNTKTIPYMIFGNDKPGSNTFRIQGPLNWIGIPKRHREARASDVANTVH